ncbi:hypothetical protein SAMN04515695_3331 [Pseudovibrio sp. Tun.PSC04-5.I4]|nr:hypothetical protein SAMN04515695_3331 [Pseudovibrio sp. Tun.PSC04-5.I4]
MAERQRFIELILYRRSYYNISIIIKVLHKKLSSLFDSEIINCYVVCYVETILH